MVWLNKHVLMCKVNKEPRRKNHEGIKNGASGHLQTHKSQTIFIQFCCSRTVRIMAMIMHAASASVQVTHNCKHQVKPHADFGI